MYTLSISKKNTVVNTPSTILKTYSELNCYAFKNKLDKELVLFYELRSINSIGSGFIPFNVALESLKTIFHYSESSAYRILSNSENIFYEYCKSNQGVKTIKLFSLEKIALKFKLQHLSLPTLINFKDCKDRKTVRAWLYSTIFKTETYNKQIHPMSHKTIREITGLDIERQQRYNKLVDIKITPNFSNEPTIYEGKSNKYVSAKQFGNSYETKLEKGHKGMLGKINRNLNKQFRKPSCSEKAYDTKPELRFYHDVKNIKGIFGESYLIEKCRPKYNLWSKV